MKHPLRLAGAAGIAAVLGAGLNVSAQAPTSEGQTTRPTIVTGCLQRLPNAASATADRPRFRITDTRSIDVDAIAGGSSYRLTGQDALLQDFVGYEVQITGTIDQNSLRQATAAQASAEARLPILRVDDMLLLSTSCWKPQAAPATGPGR